QHSDWVTREGGVMAGFADARLIEGLFDENLRENDENVEAVEVERGKLVAARVTEFETSRELSFDEVRDDIIAELTRQAMAERAEAEGEAAISALRSGEEVEGVWSASRTLTRANPGLPEAAARTVFAVPDETLPAYAGAPMPDGRYVVYRIES